MHPSAFETGRLFFETYWRDNFCNVLDIGSRDFNGTLREVKPSSAAYIGVDLSAGPGVDVVLSDPNRLPFDDTSFDVVVSTSCFEHDPLFWITFGEMLRVVKPGGIVYINAPSNGMYHGYPFDHWRFYPDAGKALEIWSSRLERPAVLLESFIGRKVKDVWADNVMVFCREPVPEKLPELPLHKRLTGCFNVRMRGSDAIQAFEVQPEDLCDLSNAIETVSELRAQLEASGAKIVRLEQELQSACLRSAPPQDLPAMGFRGRDIRSKIPLEALCSIQHGTMQYSYRGLTCWKNPFDLALYLKLLFALKPRTLIELGSHAGGSALWFADMLVALGISGRVISLDKPRLCDGVSDPHITFLEGDVLNLGGVLTSELLAGLERPLMVIEDSAHLYDTTLAALRFFDNHLAEGDYIVIEDGIVNDLGPMGYAQYENGPNRAIMEFLSEQPDKYIIDTDYCDFFGHNFTYNTNGYLRRVQVSEALLKSILISQNAGMG